MLRRRRNIVRSPFTHTDRSHTIEQHRGSVGNALDDLYGRVLTPTNVRDEVQGMLTDQELVANQMLLENAEWRDINIGGAQLALAAAGNPDKVAVGGTSIITYAFDGNATPEELHGCVELQHDYSEGTPLFFHLHWYATDANTGNVEWNVDYWIRHSAAVLSTGTLTAVTAVPGVSWQGIFTDLGQVNGEGLRIGSQIFVRLWRDPTDGDDTYGHDAAIGTFGIHYQVDTLGSAYKDHK